MVGRVPGLGASLGHDDALAQPTREGADLQMQRERVETQVGHVTDRDNGIYALGLQPID